MANPDSLRPVSASNFNTDSFRVYTASLSPYLQGTEIVQYFQLLDYVGAKIRSNTSPVIARSGSSQGWQATGEGFQAYNDELAPDNYGILRTRNVDVYTLGRAKLGPDGQTSYITFVTSGSSGFVASGSTRSQASLFVHDRLDTYISHFAEKRDLGQVDVYDDGNPFEECDVTYKNPKILLEMVPESLVLPISLVQAGTSNVAFDGVIEAQDIRKVSDRSSIDLPFVIKGPKGSLSVSDDNMKSYQFSDTYDIRQVGSFLGTAPYLDSVGIFGVGSASIDQPGAFADSPEKISPHVDTSRLEDLFPTGSLDSTMRNMFVSGIVSSSQQYFTPDINYFPTYLVAARHGFVFSQNDNYGYDSMAFGGLKK
jgi:hypothetical protein